MNFSIIDWIIVVAYLSVSVYLGLRAKKYVENMDGYFVAGRKVKVALGCATLIATEIGTVTFMYMSELGYLTGFSCFFLGIIGAIGFFFVGKTGFIVTKLRQLKIITIPELYELRYNKNIRFLGGILLFLSGVLNMGIFLKFDGMFLAETMGFGQDVLFIIMTIMFLIVVSYTVLGGMFSVIVTDFMQFVVLAFGILLITILILLKLSFGEISLAVTNNLGAEGVNPFVNMKFGWAFILWMLVGSLAGSALWQPSVSKSLSSESPEVGRKVFLYTGLTLAGRSMIPMFWGVAALAYFGPNINSALAMPKLLGAIVPTGLLGIVIASMLAASMSTYSAYLLSWSSVATRDIIAPLLKKPLSEQKTMNMTKIISVMIGLYLLIFGLWYQIPATAFQYLAVTGAMYSSGAFSCVAFGLYWKKANVVGAYAGLFFGAIAPILFLVFEKFEYLLPQSLKFIVDVNISGFLSMTLAILGMIIGSLLTQKSHPPIMIKELEN